MIGAQLDSFVAQTHQDWSLWVSDDGSTDDTMQILEHFSHRHPGRNIHILQGPGLGSAANFLHLLCHPDLPSGIVALSDQDDVWLPQKLERAVTQLQATGHAPSVWAARYWITDKNLKPIHCSDPWLRGPSLENALVQNILSGHTITLNPAALALVRQAGTPRVPHHDWWIYLLLMACGAQAILEQQPMLYYRQHDANTVGRRSAPSARFKRLAALKRGQLRNWITANLDALLAADIPLTPKARQIAQSWLQADPPDKARVLLGFGVHRQSRAETGLIHLAARMGKL